LVILYLSIGLKTDVICWEFGLIIYLVPIRQGHRLSRNQMATSEGHNPVTYTLGAIRGNQGAITFTHQRLNHEFGKSLLPAGAN
jgi:hypothetical protein